MKPYDFVFLMFLCTGYIDASVVVSEGTWQLLHCGSKERHKTVPCCVVVVAVLLISLVGCCLVGQSTSWSVGWLVGEVPEGA